MTRIPPGRRHEELERQLVREKRRRNVLVELLLPLHKMVLELLDLSAQASWVVLVLNERKASLRQRIPSSSAGPMTVSHAKRLAPKLIEALKGYQRLSEIFVRAQRGADRFQSELLEAARAGVHQLEGRAGGRLRAELAAVQLGAQEAVARVRSFFARYGSGMYAEVDEREDLEERAASSPRARGSGSPGAPIAGLGLVAMPAVRSGAVVRPATEVPRPPAQDDNVFWWREAKGKAVGPKRLSMRS